jgi:hypothetical protein
MAIARRQARSKFVQRFQILTLLFAGLWQPSFCCARVFVATRHLFEKTEPSGVMHLFIGCKLEMEKPREYPPRR